MEIDTQHSNARSLFRIAPVGKITQKKTSNKLLHYEQDKDTAPAISACEEWGAMLPLSLDNAANKIVKMSHAHTVAI